MDDKTLLICSLQANCSPFLGAGSSRLLRNCRFLVIFPRFQTAFWCATLHWESRKLKVRKSAFVIFLPFCFLYNDFCYQLCLFFIRARCFNEISIFPVNSCGRFCVLISSRNSSFKLTWFWSFWSPWTKCDHQVKAADQCFHATPFVFQPLNKMKFWIFTLGILIGSEVTHQLS